MKQLGFFSRLRRTLEYKILCHLILPYNFFAFPVFRLQTMRLSSEYGTRHMLSNAMLKENDVKINNMDKVGGG